MIYNNISTTDEVHPRLFSDIKIQPHMCLELLRTVFGW